MAGEPPTVNFWYHLTDHQFSTVALIDNTAELVERITYDAYGEARHHWPGDLTGDGEVNAADQTAMAAAYKKILGEANYNVDADITRTGTVDHIDAQWTATKNFKASLPKGVLSSPAAAGSGGGNTIGYAGYVFNAETLIYTVRFRHYDPGLGRWLERDPLGYVDGMSLYEYVGSSPINSFDPFGLSAVHARIPWVIVVNELMASGKTVVEMGLILLAMGASAALVAELLVVDEALVRWWMLEEATPEPKPLKELDKLTDKEIDALPVHPHEIKQDKNTDLYRDRDGNVYEGPSNGEGFGDPTGYCI